MKKLITVLFGIFIFILTVNLFDSATFASSVDEVQSRPHTPELIDEGSHLFGKGSNGNSEIPGEWYAGETPDNILPNSPVLLFVPGLNSKAQIWWEENDMYNTAFQAGYETAFVQLHDAGGESANMWNNGMLLAEKIKEISEYYNGKEITIIAHSKGGVDTQTALSHYEAWPYVKNVITLSSPHHGSQLADLAYSNWAGWLAELIGMKGEGTESMQMGYMENHRLEMDAHPLAYKNNYYTMGGTGWGSVFSANWFGGVYLSSYGDNDGVVTANSSKLPLANEIAIGNWDHSKIRTEATFSIFQPYISSNPSHISTSLQEKTSAKSAYSDFSHYIRGGELVGESSEVKIIPIEEQNNEVTISLLTAHDLASIKLIDPTGKEVTPKVKKSIHDDAYFSGAINHELTIAKPQAGEWKLEFKTKENSAYLVTTAYQSTDKVSMSKKMKQGNLMYHINNKALDPNTMEITYRITPNDNEDSTQTITTTGNQSLSQNLHLNKQTLYNITVDIEGKTKSGELFKRTMIESVYIK